MLKGRSCSYEILWISAVNLRRKLSFIAFVVLIAYTVLSKWIIVQTFISSQLLTHTDMFERRILNFSIYNGKYCVLYNLWEANVEDIERITLAVHTNQRFINHIPLQILSWNGPISVAIHIQHPVFDYANDGLHVVSSSFRNLLEALDAMKENYYTKNVSLHLFFEQLENIPCTTIYLKNSKFPTLSLALAAIMRTESRQIYPINVARNIARKGSKTKLLLSNDIENIMVRNYEQRMQILASELLLRQKKKTVLVHRRFEIDHTLNSLPMTKKELEELYIRKQAIQFHQYVHSIGHYIPGISEWFRVPENFTTATVAKEYHYLNAEWEPQFVADTSIPMHDERFPFRMRSHTHLGSLLCRQGYTFTLVNDLFSMHRGIKKVESKEEQYWKAFANRHGYKNMVRRFRAMLDEMYPETKNNCPFPNLS